MILRPPRSTRTDTLVPYTTLFRSVSQALIAGIVGGFGRGFSANANSVFSGITQGADGTREKLSPGDIVTRSEEHTSELQSLMRISYAVFCLKKTPNRESTSEITTHNTTV